MDLTSGFRTISSCSFPPTQLPHKSQRYIEECAGTEKDGLPIGTQAPSFSYTLVRDIGRLTLHFPPRESWSLLMIADPECASCRNAVAALTKLEPQLKSKLRMLIITTSEPAFVEAVNEFHLSPIEIGYVEKGVVYKTYLTNTTPFLYIIDAEGVIRAKRVTEDVNGIKKAIREAEQMDDPQFVEVQSRH